MAQTKTTLVDPIKALAKEKNLKDLEDIQILTDNAIEQKRMTEIEQFIKNSTNPLMGSELDVLFKMIAPQDDNILANTLAVLTKRGDKRTNLTKKQLEKRYTKIQAILSDENDEDKEKDYITVDEVPPYLFNSDLNKTRWVSWETGGVTLYKKEKVKLENGSWMTKVYPSYLYKWGEFEILSKFTYDTGQKEKTLYNFQLNGEKHWDRMFKEVKSELQSICFQYDSSKEAITNVLQQYCDNVKNDISDRITIVLGFTPAGWRLPPDFHYILSNAGATGKSVYKRFFDLMNKKYLYGTVRTYLLTERNGKITRTETTKNPEEIVELYWYEGEYQKKTGRVEIERDDSFKPNERRFIIREYDNIEEKSIPREEDAKKYMYDLYHATGIQYKDIIFAYNLAAPYFYALRDKTLMLPHVALMGSKDTGKTSATKMGTTKFYGHTEDVLGIGEFGTKARADQWFASSTFPIAMDDCQDLSMNATRDMKSYCTGKTYYSRLDKDLSYKVRIPYSAPVNLNFNEDPDLLFDSAYRDRLIRLYIEKIEKNPNWKGIYDSAPDGYIGRHLIEKTKNWTLKDVYNIFLKADSLGCKKKGREKDIIKMVGVGVWIMKEFFEIDLDISDLPKAIEDTKDLMGDAARQYVLHFIEFGIPEFSGSLDRNTGSETKEKKNESGIENWVASHGVWNQVSECVYKGESGYALTEVNLSDLNKNFKQEYSLPSLAHELQEGWKTVHHGQHTHFQWRWITKDDKGDYQKIVKGRSKSIFIPREYVLPFLNSVKVKNPLDLLSDAELEQMEADLPN